MTTAKVMGLRTAGERSSTLQTSHSGHSGASSTVASLACTRSAVDCVWRSMLWNGATGPTAMWCEYYALAADLYVMGSQSMDPPVSLMMLYHAWDEMGGASVGSIRQRSGPGTMCDFLPLLAHMHRIAAPPYYTNSWPNQHRCQGRYQAMTMVNDDY